MDSTRQDSEQLFRDALINKILVATAVVAVTAIASAQMRAFKIGWAYRDILQLVVVSSILVLVLFRHQLKTSLKALALIILYSIGGISGFYSLGMLGGTVFIFPAAAVVVAIFYSVRATWIYIGSSLLICCLIGAAYSSGLIKLAYRADLLMTSFPHWVVYLACMAFFFAVTYVTIHNYRKTMASLIEEISRNHDQLKRTHEELVEASRNVKILSGLLPICCNCKKIRDDKGYWNQIEIYIKEHSEADFSHSLCPSCLNSLYPKDDE